LVKLVFRLGLFGGYGSRETASSGIRSLLAGDKITQSRGAGSVEKKVKALRDLFSLAREDEKKFLVGLIGTDIL